MKAPICIDFETEGIAQRPAYPPVPVGFSIKRPGERKSTYYAWGHPTENNCTKEAATAVLRGAWLGGAELLFHNSKFDIDVAETHMGMPPLPWERTHDTLYLVFLEDPHASTFSLKPSSERLLNMPSEERDAVKDWILANVPEAKQKPSEWGAYICRAPGKLVGEYANGDVMRTVKLFNLLYPRIKQRGMLKAYDRERRLMPILLRNEREGIRLDMPQLTSEIKLYESALVRADQWCYKKLGGELNLDSNEDLAEALLRLDPTTQFLLTPKGNRSVAKDSLQQAVKDPELFLALGYRSRLSTCLTTFMRPWLGIGRATGGRVLPSWSQVRQASGDKNSKGARTGRLICAKPNLLNLSKDFEGRNDGYTHPKFLAVPILPLVRRYMLPDKGGVWGHRDYASQELRVLAHFEDGSLLRQYLENPRLDVHEFVRTEILRIVGLQTERRQAKILNFGLIYGMGIGALANDLKTDTATAGKLKSAQLSALPDLKAFEKDIKARGRSGEGIHTWGGRHYLAEPPKVINGHMRTFEYKLLNYLVQSSAADATKEAVIRYDAAKKEGRFLVTVYDELNASMPKGVVKKEMKILNDVMASLEFDVPMLSDGKVGPSWGALEKYND